jgi:PAS domain S-box-containing protein
MDGATGTSTVTGDRRVDVVIPTAAGSIALSDHVLEAAPIGMLLVAPDGRVLWCNHAVADLLGTPQDEIVDEPLASHVEAEPVHDDVDHIDAPWSSVLDRTDRVVEREQRWRRSDGSTRWVTVRGSLAVGPDDVPVELESSGACMVLQVLDITEQRRVEQDLLRSNEELLEFAHVASHDLSEPLRVVAGHVELLARRYEGRLDDDADEMIRFAVDGCKRMRSLIDDLLAYSRAGRPEEEMGAVELGPLVDDVLTSLATTLTSVDAQVVVDALPTVVGSRRQLAQVMSNLIANAVKFRIPDQAPRIHVGAVRSVGAWDIRVADHGIGIPERCRERIFRMFQRLHAASDYPGTGIGLALCRKIATAHGGSIWVEDGPDDTTVFVLRLPDPGSVPA